MLNIEKTTEQKLIYNCKIIPVIFYIQYIVFYIYNIIYPNTEWFKLDPYLFCNITIGCILIYLSELYKVKYK